MIFFIPIIKNIHNKSEFFVVAIIYFYQGTFSWQKNEIGNFFEEEMRKEEEDVKKQTKSENILLILILFIEKKN